MVKITNVYTKNGDQGQTSLAAGRAISKISSRIRVIGDLDELNAYIGFAANAMIGLIELENLLNQCIRIQNELFDLGAQLAVLREDRRPNTPMVREENVDLLEKEIDERCSSLPILNSFILPGGSEIACRLHIARTICRRVERSLVYLLAEEEVLDGFELPYLNRLSDWLFVSARFSIYALGNEELLWRVEKKL